MKCSFCGTPREKVKKLLASGPRRAICDECVMEATKVLSNPEVVAMTERDFLMVECGIA